MEKVWYFIQVSICVSIFYGLYFVFFKNTTFFIANRIYLLAGLIFSFIIPVLKLSHVTTDYHLMATEFINLSSLSPFHVSPNPAASAEGQLKISVIPTIYWIGFTFMISRLLFSIIKIIKIGSRSAIHWNGTTKTYRADSIQPFSFFNLIFLPTRAVNPLVFNHEKAHVKQYHWVDLLFTEIASAFLWFNPVMILFGRSIRIQHEYEADAYALRSGGLLEDYLECIFLHLQHQNIHGPVSQFHSSNIKNRILMMTKKKTSAKFSLLYMLFVPVGCMLLFAFSSSSIRTIAFADRYDPPKQGDPVIIVDAGHGGNDAGTQSSEGISEKEIVLSMAKNIQAAGLARNVTVILTRSGDEALTLRERILIANVDQADVFISLHLNFDQENAAASGIGCLVSEKNNRFDDSERLAKKLIHEIINTQPGIKVNGIKKSNPYILSRNRLPAVLLDLGYLSNKTDFAYLTDEKNQQLLSESIITAVVAYKK